MTLEGGGGAGGMEGSMVVVCIGRYGSWEVPTMVCSMEAIGGAPRGGPGGPREGGWCSGGGDGRDGFIGEGRGKGGEGRGKGGGSVWVTHHY